MLKRQITRTIIVPVLFLLMAVPVGNINEKADVLLLDGVGVTGGI